MELILWDYSEVLSNSLGVNFVSLNSEEFFQGSNFQVPISKLNHS